MIIYTLNWVTMSKSGFETSIHESANIMVFTAPRYSVTFPPRNWIKSRYVAEKDASHFWHNIHHIVSLRNWHGVFVAHKACVRRISRPPRGLDVRWLLFLYVCCIPNYQNCAFMSVVFQIINTVSSCLLFYKLSTVSLCLFFQIINTMSLCLLFPN